MTNRKYNLDLKKAVNKGMDQVKKTANNANEFVYSTSEDVVDFSIKSGAEWQEVSEKAIKAGLKLSANQQDIMFDALEVVKGQIIKSGKRFKHLFSKN
jgi:hypothetical protein